MIYNLSHIRTLSVCRWWTTLFTLSKLSGTALCSHYLCFVGTAVSIWFKILSCLVSFIYNRSSGACLLTFYFICIGKHLHCTKIAIVCPRVFKQNWTSNLISCRWVMEMSGGAIKFKNICRANKTVHMYNTYIWKKSRRIGASPSVRRTDTYVRMPISTCALMFKSSRAF